MIATERLAALRAAGLTFAKIGARVGLSRQAVESRLVHAGLHVPGISTRTPTVSIAPLALSEGPPVDPLSRCHVDACGAVACVDCERRLADSLARVYRELRGYHHHLARGGASLPSSDFCAFCERPRTTRARMATDALAGTPIVWQPGRSPAHAPGRGGNVVELAEL